MPTKASSRLDRAVALFPGRKEQILRLALGDPLFRSLCEDLADAHDSLIRLSALSGRVERPEVSEYRVIIAELEREVVAYVEARLP